MSTDPFILERIPLYFIDHRRLISFFPRISGMKYVKYGDNSVLTSVNAIFNNKISMTNELLDCLRPFVNHFITESREWFLFLLKLKLFEIGIFSSIFGWEQNPQWINPFKAIINVVFRFQIFQNEMWNSFPFKICSE